MDVFFRIRVYSFNKNRNVQPSRSDDPIRLTKSVPVNEPYLLWFLLLTPIFLYCQEVLPKFLIEPT